MIYPKDERKLVYGGIPPSQRLEMKSRRAEALAREEAWSVSDEAERLAREEAVAALRMAPKKRGRKRGTHCGRGHEFTVWNTYVRPSDGYRNCRECSRIQYRARREQAMA